jgi:hypothetical protein
VRYGIHRTENYGENVVDCGLFWADGRAAMGVFYFTLTDGVRTFGRREATELAGFAEVQEEALAFGRSVLKHRFLLGIEDISPWGVRVSNELGRVLAVVPLSRVKKMRSAAEPMADAPPIRASVARAMSPAPPAAA